MNIKECTVKNFKGLDNTLVFNQPDGHAGSGLNIFVGENNTGKSTLFEAIHFLRKNTDKDTEILKKFGTKEQEHFVSITLEGVDLSAVADSFISNDKHREGVKKAIQSDGDQKQQLRIKRNFENKEAAKEILFLTGGEYKNITGIPASFQSFFQTSHIWAHTNPEKEASFGSSTICGNLLADISEKFKIDHAEQIARFKAEFEKTFNDKSAGLQGELDKVAKETQDILATQFGPAKLSFQFDMPEVDVFFKNIKVLVDDGSGETDISEKGHGLQRAVILALLQVYSARLSKMEIGSEIKLKPHFLFIDEPELGLHPQAQKRLFEALKIIAKTHQVFINTHSEHFISPDMIGNVFRFVKNSSDVSIFSDAKKELRLIENGNFFLHHHRLFFANKAIFLEGAEDMRRYTLFCAARPKLEALPRLFSMMGGCQQTALFEKFSDIYGIKHAIIVDVDYCNPAFCAETTFSLTGAPKKDWHSSHSGDQKYIEILEKRKKELMEKNIMLLSRCDVKEYLREDGTALDTDTQNELEAVFEFCASL